MKALSGTDYCQVTLQFPDDTIPKWVPSYIYVIAYAFIFANKVVGRSTEADARCLYL